MSVIARFPFGTLCEARELLSVANLTRQDGLDSLRVAPTLNVQAQSRSSPAGPGEPGA